MTNTDEFAQGNAYKNDSDETEGDIEGGGLEGASTSRRRFWGLIAGSIGVVYGDIGTSPLYAFREATHHLLVKGAPSEGDITGILSLILWALFFIVTIKYVLFLTRLDNKGEGGVLSLMALTQKKAQGKYLSRAVLFFGMLGAALFFGDATITPAISVLSAVEGLDLASPGFSNYVLPIAVFILVLLFVGQKNGTERVSYFFGPVMIVWFLVISGMGIYWICQEPQILHAFNPIRGYQFLHRHSGFLGFGVLGSVFLAVTGAEALYADMGHFGSRPISKAWLYFVFPALALNYLGQGALLLRAPEATDNPFYYMVPEWALLPLVGLAALATVIASQAVITGAFSLTHQAINLGLLPRMEIRKTSQHHSGQIYIPKINQNLLTVVLLLILVFRDSGSLASAYGIAVTGTMLITAFLSAVVIAKVWSRGWMVACLVMAPFFMVETTFFLANMTKFFSGGFLPIFMAIAMLILMSTWIKGSKYLSKKIRRMSMPIVDFVEIIDRQKPHIVKGTAIFMTSDVHTAPYPLIQNIKHNRILHEMNVIVMVRTSQEPKIPVGQRLVIQKISSNVILIAMNFGYMEPPDVPEALSQARWHGVEIDLKHATYFIGKRHIIPHPRRGLPIWQDYIYIYLTKYAAPATDFYKIPHNHVMEIGTRITI